MNLLPQYKSGDLLFRLLAEARLRFHRARNGRHFSAPPPHNMRTAAELNLKTTIIHPSLAAPLAEPRQVFPDYAERLVRRREAIGFAPAFVASPLGATVLGEGHVLADPATLLADTTTDFHRHPEHHFLLAEKAVPEPVPLGGSLAVVASPGNDNYFHWTLVSVPRFQLLEQSGAAPDAYYANKKHRFQREWLDMLDIPPERVVDATPATHLRPDRLILPSFFGTESLPRPEAIDFLRGFVPAQRGNSPEKIYISRADARRRRLRNEREIEGILQKKGFKTVYPGQMGIREQMVLFAGAREIVAVHGAELTNLVYCTPGTRVVELLPPTYPNPCFRELAGLCGLCYTTLFGTGSHRLLKKGMDAHHVWNNLKIDPRQLENILDS